MENYEDMKKTEETKVEFSEIKEDITEITPENENDPIEINDDDNTNYKEISPIRLVLRRFFRSKLSIVGLVMIIGLFLFSFLGPVIYDSWGETEIDQTPVTTTAKEVYTFTDPDGFEHEITQIIEVQLTENAKAPIGSYGYNHEGKKCIHLLGTDEKGYDVFSRLMYGGRISLSIGFIVVILETLLGIIIGGISGYFGKWVDQICMRIVDIFNCIPTLPILLIASAVIDSLGVPGSARIYWLMVIITVFGWSGTARIVRGQILSLREQEFITATEVMGLPTWRKIFKHLIPNVMPQLIVSMTLGLGSVILYESTLSYLGLGVQYPFAAWGTMISGANDPVILANYTNIWLPAGIMIVLAVLGFNFVGDGLRDAMDPKARK